MNIVFLARAMRGKMTVFMEQSRIIICLRRVRGESAWKLMLMTHDNTFSKNRKIVSIIV